MNLDELQSVQSRERQTDSLQQLRADFYEDAAGFVQELRERREEAAARAEDPFDSPDVNRLTDDIRTAEQTVEAIYERRVGKVVKMASLAAADMPTEDEGLTKEERELFETMVQAIEDHREAILTTLGGDAPTGAVSAQPREDAAPTEQEGEEPALDASAMMGEGDEEPAASRSPNRGDDDAAPAGPDEGDEPPRGPDGEPGVEERDGPDGTAEPADAPPNLAEDTSTETDPGAPATDDEAPDSGVGIPEGDERASEEVDDASPDVDLERVTVRITEDVGEIFGVDEREYDLASDDVVTLPATNAQPLIDRDAAEPVE